MQDFSPSLGSPIDDPRVQLPELPLVPAFQSDSTDNILVETVGSEYVGQKP